LDTPTGKDGDYSIRSHIIRFPAGITRMPFIIQITNDNIFEDNEYFNLTINSSSLPSDVNVKDPYHVTITIIDDDREYTYVAVL